VTEFIVGIVIGLALAPIYRSLAWYLWSRREGRFDVMEPEWKWRLIRKERQERGEQ